MTKMILAILALWFCVAVHADDHGVDWVQRSNEIAKPVLELLAKYNPEAAGRYGLDGYDDAVLDLEKRVYQRNRADTSRVIDQLKQGLRKEVHPKVKQDLELLVQVLTDRQARNERRHRVLLPYINVAEIVFENTKALLDPNVAPSRYPAAVVRLKHYAGMVDGERPITELARQRTEERFDVDGLIGPYRGKVEKDIANSDRFVKGIKDLMLKYELDGWEDSHAAFAKQIQLHNNWLRSDVLPRSRDDHKLPSELYVDRLQTYGVRMKPRELIERAQFGYMEIRNEMEAIAKRIASDRDWKSNGYRDVIDRLKQEQLATVDILPFYEQRLKDIEQIIERERIVTLPKRKCRIRFATAAESARIPAPSVVPPRLIGNTGEYGTFLIPLSNPNAKSGDKMDDFLHDSIAWTLTAHEARPGHEMQFSAIVDNGVSVARAVFSWNSANVEGWGLYAEAIMQEHLPPEGQLFTLHMRLLRAARAFLDPMLNLGKLKPHQAKSFLMREVLLSEPMAAQEIDRYTSWMPGQATSYYYGFMKLQALRTQVELALGDSFDQLRYHDFILAQGLLSPDLLQKAVLDEYLPAELESQNSGSHEVDEAPASDPHHDADVDLEFVKRRLAEHIKRTLADTGIPSFSIALMKDDRIVWTEAFGYANATLKTAASPATIYAVASCFKPVTAMAVMQLVDKGLVKLDDPINQYLGQHSVADLTDEGKPVTIRHLLSHYSGLTVSTELVSVWERKLPKTLEQHAAQLKSKRAPGIEYEYSNSGYTLAGLLIQEVTGQSYEQYIVDNILKPLGITNTNPVDPNPEMLERLANPYKLVKRKAIPEIRYRLDVYPAGDIHISAPDLSKVLLAQLNGGKSGKVRLLSAAAIQEMQTPQFEGNDGLDFGIVDSQGEKLVMHGGGIPGYSSKFILATKAKVGVFIVSNAREALLSNDITAQLAIDLLRGKEVGKALLKRVVHVGISFREDKSSKLLRVGDVFPNSPASRAGISVGQLIRRIDETDVKGKSLSQCLKLMQGPEGTAFQFEILDSDSEQIRHVELEKRAFLAPG